MSIKTQGHKEACILISQLRVLWLVVGYPSRVHLNRQKESWFEQQYAKIYVRHWQCLHSIQCNSFSEHTQKLLEIWRKKLRNQVTNLMQLYEKMNTKSGSGLTCEAGAILSPAATPLWKLGQLVMLGGTSMFPLFRSTIVFLGGARPEEENMCILNSRNVGCQYLMILLIIVGVH